MNKITYFLIKKLIYSSKGEVDPQKQLESLRYIPLLIKLIWECAPKMVATSAFLRLLSAFLPVSMLYVGKLIIDEVLREVKKLVLSLKINRMLVKFITS